MGEFDVSMDLCVMVLYDGDYFCEIEGFDRYCVKVVGVVVV